MKALKRGESSFGAVSFWRVLVNGQRSTASLPDGSYYIISFFFEHKSHEFNESLRETKRKPFMEIHGQFMAIGVKHKLSEITRELSEIIFAFFAAFARDK